MIDPIKPPGGPSPQNPPEPIKPAQGKSFKQVESEEAERQVWWGGYFSPSQLKIFKENLLKFLSTQFTYETQQLKKASKELEKSEEGKD